jgi:hypothetical protein
MVGGIALAGLFVAAVCSHMSKEHMDEGDVRRHLEWYLKNVYPFVFENKADRSANRNFKVAYVKERVPCVPGCRCDCCLEDVFSHYVPAFNMEKQDD